jgi:hypothetical protein
MRPPCFHASVGDSLLSLMHYVSLIFATLLLGLIAKCGGPTPTAPPQSKNKSTDPCNEQVGVSYSPVGRIVRVKELPLKDQRDYGTHALIDGSGNVQWILQSSRVNLDPYAGDNKWYRVDGRQSIEHPDLFVVCAISFSQ